MWFLCPGDQWKWSYSPFHIHLDTSLVLLAWNNCPGLLPSGCWVVGLAEREFGETHNIPKHKMVFFDTETES